MKSSFLPFGLLLALLAPSATAETVKPREFDRAHPWGTEMELKIRHGDDPAWARPDFDDGDWQEIGRRELPSRDGIYWLRARVKLADRETTGPIDAVAIAIVASYDIYWDGRLLGRSGVVGTDRASEVPGPVDQVFPLPDTLLQPSEHIVALRLSSFRTGFPAKTYGIYLGMTTQRAYFTARSRAASFATVAVGGGFVLGILLLLVGLLVNRRPSPILLGLVCMGAALVQALQAWRGLFHYSYDWHYYRVLFLIVSVGVLGLLLVTFVAVSFRLRHAWLWVAAQAAAIVTVWLIDFPEANTTLEIFWWFALLESAGLAAWALRCGDRRAAFVLAGLLVSCLILAWNPVDFREQSFLHGMGATMLGCIIATTLQLRADRMAARQAQLTAARLEIEVLKKNIQPHFLLNTLTTLTEVIEQEPKIAVTLIDALAAEFRLLARISGERLVPMRQELELCREHLRVMSLRQDVLYSLRTDGVCDDTWTPPALILTLVENGLTHARAQGEAVEFVLRAQADGDFERLVFFAPEPQATAITGKRAAQRSHRSPGAIAEGTGSRYVKARLEESFPGRWKFASGPVPGGWETTIEFRRVTKEAPRT